MWSSFGAAHKNEKAELVSDYDIIKIFCVFWNSQTDGFGITPSIPVQGGLVLQTNKKH